MRAEGFFCNLDILYGGLGIGKLQFLIKKNLIFFSAVIFFQFWSLKPWIRIGVQPKMLDPDPDEMNADPQPCFEASITAQTIPFQLSHPTKLGKTPARVGNL